MAKVAKSFLPSFFFRLYFHFKYATLELHHQQQNLASAEVHLLSFVLRLRAGFQRTSKQAATSLLAPLAV
jgi:hypothetical protein